MPRELTYRQPVTRVGFQHLIFSCSPPPHFEEPKARGGDRSPHSQTVYATLYRTLLPTSFAMSSVHTYMYAEVGSLITKEQPLA